jgi:GxxExxY protein
VIVELKAIKALTQIEEAQVINYLKGTHFNRAILFNFGTPKMEYKRLVYGTQDNSLLWQSV